MKTIFRSALLAGCLAFLPAGQALAACGIGTTLWGSPEGIVGKVFAFTTNVWTFKGISTTSEISGCTEEDNIFKKADSGARVRHFASENLDHLAVGMARGSGEHLDAFAHVIRIEEQDLEAFRQLTHHHFTELFPHDYATSGEMLEVLGRLMKRHDTLATYVRS